MFDTYKPAGCATFSGTCSKLLVETCIPLGDGDLHTSCTSWLSASFFEHADYSGIGGACHMTGVIGLLAPGFTCSGSRSFHKRPLDFGMKYLSQKEIFFATQACCFQPPIGLVGRRLSAPGNCT